MIEDSTYRPYVVLAVSGAIGFLLGTTVFATWQVAVESAQVSDFRSVQSPPPDGSKNGKLSYSHAGLGAWTDRKAGNGARRLMLPLPMRRS